MLYKIRPCKTTITANKLSIISLCIFRPSGCMGPKDRASKYEIGIIFSMNSISSTGQGSSRKHIDKHWKPASLDKNSILNVQSPKNKIFSEMYWNSEMSWSGKLKNTSKYNTGYMYHLYLKANNPLFRWILRLNPWPWSELYFSLFLKVETRSDIMTDLVDG